MKKQNLSDEEIADFRRFVLDSEPCIDELKVSLGMQGDKLDFSPDSLKFIDELLKQRIRKEPEREPLRWNEITQHKVTTLELNKEEIWLIVRVAYYFAEVLIRNLRVEWNLEDRTKRRHYGRAVIKIDDKSDGIEPLGLVWRSGTSNNSKGLYFTYDYVQKILSK